MDAPPVTPDGGIDPLLDGGLDGDMGPGIDAPTLYDAQVIDQTTSGADAGSDPQLEGGCGCRTTDAAGEDGLGLLLLVFLLLLCRRGAPFCWR